MIPLDAVRTLTWSTWIGFAVIAVAIVAVAVRVAVRPSCAPISTRWVVLPGAAVVLGAGVALVSWLFGGPAA